MGLLICDICLNKGKCTSTPKECLRDINPRKGRQFIDKEWYEAEHTGKRVSWWVYPNYKYEPYKRFLRCYTPALAKLMHERTGWTIVQLGKEDVRYEKKS